MYCARKWKNPRLVIALFFVELGGTIAALALFGIAAPDLFRTNLWQDGSDNGFNSSPNQVLYAYANYRPIPKTPLIWSSFLTNYNIVISIFSMFVLLVKAVMFVMHVWYPLLSAILHAIIVALWAVSVYGQASPDYSDPEHPSKIAWYLAKPCSVAHKSSNIHGCQMMKGTFAVTIVMLAVFFFHIPLSIYSMYPSKTARHARMTSLESEANMKESPHSDSTTEQQWEANGDSKRGFELGAVPAGIRNPTTPRTTAFNALSGRLPLRSQK